MKETFWTMEVNNSFKYNIITHLLLSFNAKYTH